MNKFLSILGIFLAITFPILAESKEKVKSEMEAYLPAEKLDARWYMGVGGTSVLLGAYWAGQNDQYAKGMALPFLGLGLAEVISGSITYFGTDKQFEVYQKQLDSNPKKFKETEYDRMYKANRNRGIYRAVEVALLGAGMYFYYQGQQEKLSLLDSLQGKDNMGDYKKGLGTGLILHTSFLLIMDYISDKRASNYTESLYNFHAVFNPPTRDREGVYGIGATIRF